MSEKYESIQKQIKQNRKHIYKNIKITIKRALKKCNQIKKIICSNRQYE